MGGLLLLVAVICFVLATFGVEISGHPLVPPGLAFFAAAGLAPVAEGFWRGRPVPW